jgi:hypothetical protein
MTAPPDGPAVTIGVSPEHPALQGRTGLGVLVAVIDSGVHADHPHVEGVLGGVAIEEDGSQHGDYVDRLGHGTAVTAAIKEKAPETDIYAIKVFGRTLSTSTGVLVRAIDLAIERGARLINLSLGTAKTEHELTLWAAVDRARKEGAVVVSPKAHEGRYWLPGSLEGAGGVVLDWGCPRDQLRVVCLEGQEPAFVASGFPRPISGVSPERNLKGVSFAAANTTGILARLVQERPELRSVGDIVALLKNSAG